MCMCVRGWVVGIGLVWLSVTVLVSFDGEAPADTATQASRGNPTARMSPGAAVVRPVAAADS